MARKAKSIVSRGVYSWECRLDRNSDVFFSIATDLANQTWLVASYWAIGSGFTRCETMDETAINLARSILAGGDEVAILADRIEELDSPLVAHYFRVANNEILKEQKKRQQAEKRKLNRMRAEDAMKSLGMRKVRGAMGGTYWE